MNEHYSEELELYALGDLDEQDRAAIEAHALTCAECARRLGEAEETLASMSSLLPAYRAPQRRPSTWKPTARIAVAAAFVAGLLVAAFTLAFVNVGSGSNDDVRAQIAMTHAHFQHVQLAPVAAGAPAAKVIYAQDRSWLYVIVDDGRSGYRLLSAGPSGAHELAALVAHGGSSSVFIEHPPDSSTLELALGSSVVARGTLR
ncbi:MAG: zf-HC2 domain-containing protein [Vulcanimicrobiaceae bacterium]